MYEKNIALGYAAKDIREGEKIYVSFNILDGDLFLSSDEIHISRDGSRFFTERLFRYFNKWLCDTRLSDENIIEFSRVAQKVKKYLVEWHNK